MLRVPDSGAEPPLRQGACVGIVLQERPGIPAPFAAFRRSARGPIPEGSAGTAGRRPCCRAGLRSSPRSRRVARRAPSSRTRVRASVADHGPRAARQDRAEGSVGKDRRPRSSKPRGVRNARDDGRLRSSDIHPDEHPRSVSHFRRSVAPRPGPEQSARFRRP